MKLRHGHETAHLIYTFSQNPKLRVKECVF